jgi:hypothetical protein
MYPQLCSIFYVLYLFAMSTEGYLEEQVYPARFNLQEKPWLSVVLRWAHISRECPSMDSLSAHKVNFFEEENKVLQQYGLATSPYWKDDHALTLCFDIFYNQMWPHLPDHDNYGEPERTERSKGGSICASNLLEQLGTLLVNIAESDTQATVLSVT